MVIGNPFPLKVNTGKSFQGSIVLGKGFVLTTKQAEDLIMKDKRNEDVLFPYLNGEDLNNDPEQKPSRWVINFFDWPEERARTYPDCFEIVEQLVKSERMEQNDKGGKEQWWRFLRPRKELYETISKLDQVMVINNHTRHHVFAFYSEMIVFSHALSVLAIESKMKYAILSSSIMNEWAWHQGSTMGASTLRYTSSEIFETFPFPSSLSQQKEEQLDILGENYNKHQKQIMTVLQLGLTKTYNLFHSDSMFIDDGNMNDRYTEALRKHLGKTATIISLKEAAEDIIKLRKLHVEMDKVVLDSYGWIDIQLNHGFYEMSYLPENDRIRFSIHPDARKEILMRLLKLNHQLHSEERENESVVNDRHSKKNKGEKENISPKLF